MNRLRFGTMGFGYADWAGAFYPDGMKAADYLSHYAKHFDTVELDTTFHATPPVERVRRWADVTPDRFRFSAKTPKDITHDGALDRRVGPMLQFIEVMRALESKLAAVLVQLPPSCGIDQFEALETFVRGMPRDVRFAVEFRNASWGRQRTLDLLREHRWALVAAEYLTRPRRVLITSDFLYVRWVGEHGRFKELNREQFDVIPNLQWWNNELGSLTPPARPASAGPSSPENFPEIFGYFNNDYSGYAIATCRRFMRMMGLAVPSEADLLGERTLFG